MTFLDGPPGHDAALVDTTTGATLTFADVRAAANRTIEPLGPDRRLVLLLASNDVFSVLVYAGALSAGHPVLMLDPQSSGEALAGLVAAYRPQWVAGPPEIATRLVEAGVEVLEEVRHEGGSWARLRTVGEVELHPDLALLLTTSGTTGSRKLVRLTAANLEANARSIAQLLELTPAERPVTTLPIHYSFGLSVLNSHWAVGAAVVLTADSVMQKPLWEHVARHGATSLAGVPFTYQLLERVGFRRMDLPTITTLQQAGGALDRTLTETYAAHMRSRSGRLVVMYGQTEATARMAYVPPDRLEDKLGSAGVAVPGGRFEITGSVDGVQPDRPDRADRAGAIGEVVYSGPNVMMGYAVGHEDLGRGDDLGGVLRTGDLGRLDADGYLYLSGRSGRIAKVFGLRLNLDDVEAALRENGPAAAVGGPDVVWGFCAYGTEESLAEVGRSLARRYRIHHSALKLSRVEEIPTTSTGKTDYEQVRRWTS